jgi:hypothetical protein
MANLKRIFFFYCEVPGIAYGKKSESARQIRLKILPDILGPVNRSQQAQVRLSACNKQEA